MVLSKSSKTVVVVWLYGLNVASPTLDEDILLLPYSKNGLDNMLDICYKFFCKWRYFYNVNKCAVFVFNETVKPIQNRTFCIGSDVM